MEPPESIFPNLPAQSHLSTFVEISLSPLACDVLSEAMVLLFLGQASSQAAIHEGTFSLFSFLITYEG